MIVEAVLFIATAIILYILWYQSYSRFFQLLKKIPGPPGYPIVGNILEYLGSPEENFQYDRRQARAYYPIYHEWTLGLGVVNLFKAEDIELILSSSKHSDKSEIYEFLHRWLGTGLLTSDGAKWQNRRKILTPAFHFTILQDFVSIFNEETQRMVTELKQYVNRSIDVMEPITQFTLLSIAESSMGIKLEKDCEAYKKAIHNFGYSFNYRMGRPWLYSDYFFYNFTRLGKITHKSIQTLHNFSRNVIAEKKRNYTQVTTNKRLAMLDLLLSAKNDGANIDDEGIAEEVDTFMFEGHDTTAIAISYILLLLANNKNIQEEIYEEMKEILGERLKTPTYNDLKELNLMERCIKESLRLFPSVPIISRKVSEDVVTATGYVIPKGAMAVVHIYDLHRDPNIYPNPDRFDPDRFLPENCKDRHPFAYLPFSAGPRNCIGQKFAILELKSVLYGILSTFVLVPDDRVEDIVMITDLVLRAKNGVKVGFRFRNS